MPETLSNLLEKRAPVPWSPAFVPAPTTNNNLIVGIELEIENIPNGQEWYAVQAGDFWGVVEDGSLRPRGAAWEFVSKPVELNQAIPQLSAFFRTFGFNGSNYSDRCSVHVHTNVLDYTKEQISVLSLVYPVFEDVLFQFVNHFHKEEEQGYCRDSNIYCIPWSQCRMNRGMVEKIMSNPRNTARNWQKYTALNVVPMWDKGTVEWRHMHGTSDMEKLTTWLNLIGAIMKFSKETSLDDVIKTIKTINDVSTYQQFFSVVLQDTIPYAEEYRRAMFDGVLNAKYSLINWEKNKGKKKPTLEEIFDDEDEDEEFRIQAQVAAVDPEAQPRQRRPLVYDYAAQWPAVNPAQEVPQPPPQPVAGAANNRPIPFAELERRILEQERVRNRVRNAAEIVRRERELLNRNGQ